MRRILCIILFLFAGFSAAQSQSVIIPQSDFSDTLRARYPSCFTVVGTDLYMDTTCNDIVLEDSLMIIMPTSGSLTPIEGLQYFDNLTSLYLSIPFLDNINYTPKLPPSLLHLHFATSPVAQLPLLNNNLRTLQFFNMHNHSLPVNFPDSLRYLHLSGLQNTGFSIPSLPPFLDTLICSGIQDTTFSYYTLKSLPELPSTLKYLDCSRSAIDSIKNIPPGLEQLLCQGNYLDTSRQVRTLKFIDVLPPTLKKLICSSNFLSSFPSLPPALVELNCAGNRLSSLPPLGDSLRFLDCSYNQLTLLPALPNRIHTLRVQSNLLSQIPNLPDSLRIFQCELNQITSLPPFPDKLEAVNCNDNRIASLPSLPPLLTTFWCSNNQLTCLPRIPESLATYSSPGGGIYSSLNFAGNNINCLPNLPAGLFPYPHDTVCTVLNNRNNCQLFPVISGKVFYDVNGNGVKEVNEFYKQNVAISLGNVTHTFTDANGFYNISADTGTHVMSFNAGALFSSTPSTFSFSFSSFDTSVVQDIPLRAIRMTDSLLIKVTPIGVPRPGFEFSYDVSYENVGTNPVPAQVSLQYDPAKLSYLSSNVAGVNLSGNLLNFNAGMFQPGQIGSFQSLFRVNATALLGNSLISVAGINGGAASASDSNTMAIRGAYDPNDKLAPGSVSSAQILAGEFIDYIIRFQNTGTDTAFTVIITDTLSNWLDENSFEMVTTSHPSQATRTGKNLLFEFKNIILPDSNVNEPASHGFIRFKIKPLQAFIGSASPINNTANIYFDYNAPVVTNTAVTAFSDPSTCLTATAASTPATCTGISNGTITVTVSGGTAPYTYSLNSGTPQASPDFTALAAGVYSVKVIDVGGCADSIFVTVAAAGGFTATATATPAGCSGANIGTITIAVNGGTAPFTYSLNGGTPQAPNVFSGLTIGQRLVRVSDASGCIVDLVVVVPSSNGLVLTAAPTAASCVGVNNGSITATVSGGTGPYNYSINNGIPQISPDFIGLPSGTYSVKVTDALGCKDSLSVTVASAGGITATATSTPTSCAGVNNGTITVTPNGGTSPYTYSLNGGTSQTTGSFSSVAAGPHTVMVTDANGCTSTVNVTVAAGPGITATAATTAASCGQPDGIITVTVNGGASPYSYSLDNGPQQASSTFNNVTAGTHTVAIADASGCSASLTTVVGETPITATVTVTQPTCAAQGMILVTSPAGTAPFMYSINGGTPQTGPGFANLAAGTYTVLVQDANLCTYTETVTVNASPGTVAPSVSITASSTSVCEGEDVTFTATATNGGANPQYQWLVNGTNAGTNAATLTVNPVVNSDVSVLLTSNDPCASPATATSNTVSVTVNPSQTPSITISGNTTVGQGTSTTVNSSVLHGGTSPLYQWQDSTSTHSWTNIAGATNSSIHYTPQQTGDGLRAILTSTATCTSSSTVTSNALYFTVESTVIPRMRLYPNPVRSILTIENFTQMQWVSADILDNNGRKVSTFRNNNATDDVIINVSGLMSGVYFIRLLDRDGKPEYFKFIKQ